MQCLLAIRWPFPHLLEKMNMCIHCFGDGQNNVGWKDSIWFTISGLSIHHGRESREERAICTVTSRKKGECRKWPGQLQSLGNPSVADYCLQEAPPYPFASFQLSHQSMNDRGVSTLCLSSPDVIISGNAPIDNPRGVLHSSPMHFSVKLTVNILHHNAYSVSLINHMLTL